MTSALSTLDQDQSAALLSRRIRHRMPFFFVRYGDGAIECINGKKGRTCDFEEYSSELGSDLLAAWRRRLFSFLYRNSIHPADRFNFSAQDFVQISRQIEV